MLFMAVISGCQGKSPENLENPSSKQEIAQPTAEASSTDLLPQSGDLGLPVDSLAPEIRESLRSIKVLRLNNRNINEVWSLSSRENQGDVLILENDPEALSTGRIQALLAWARRGHGILIPARSVGILKSHLIPASTNIYSAIDDYYNTDTIADGKLTNGVEKIENYLWCSGSPKSMLQFSDSEINFMTGNTVDPLPLFAKHGESFIPIVTRGQPGAGGLVLFASTSQKARVAWYSRDFQIGQDKCQPKYDDMRLWANVLHWLANREAPET